MVRMVVGRTVLCLLFLLGGVDAARAAALDQGQVAIGDSLAMTVYLQPRHRDALERFDRALQDPGDPLFHRFLTRDGFTIGAVFPNRLALQVTGPPAPRSAPSASPCIASA